jgi:hypothetical protein
MPEQSQSMGGIYHVPACKGVLAFVALDAAARCPIYTLESNEFRRRDDRCLTNGAVATRVQGQRVPAV